LLGLEPPVGSRWEIEPLFTHPPAAQPSLQTCNCRWDGETLVQQCTLHQSHVDAIHEWAERAKSAEQKLAAQRQPLPVEQIDEIVVAELGLDADADEMHNFARAIEAAHGITGESK
jgi:hypothetical protein